MKKYLLLSAFISTFVYSKTTLVFKGLSPEQEVAVTTTLQQLPPLMQEKLDLEILIKSAKVRHIHAEIKRVGQYNDINKSITLHPDVFKEPDLLKKTMMHELAHAYEFNFERVVHIPEYQLAAGLHKRGIFPKLLKRRNYLDSASADLYEFKNLRESFPVNFEFFMTDATFQCRRPILNAFFQRYFNHSPFAKTNCQMVEVLPVTINNRLQYQQMDFSKLYQIHYLFASKGEEAMSRWGHSMIRMVFCAPHKTQLDESCNKDVAHHWVISFRANVQDIEINNIKGMLGKYPSEIFIFPMVEIIREYNKTELRDLISVPLKTTPEQLERLKHHVFETSYAYQGRYRFFTVNCATETLNFLQVVLNKDELYNTQAISPLNLLKKLNHSTLVDYSKVSDSEMAIKSGHFFRGQSPTLEQSFKKISELVPVKNFEKYIQSSAEKRQSYFAQKELSTSQLASIILLEKNIQARFEKEFMEKVAKLVVDTLDKKEIPEAVEYLENFRLNIIENNAIKYDWKGHGIPFAHEFKVPDEIQLVMPENAALEAQKWIKENFPKEQKELDAIIQNILTFTKLMNESIRRTK